MRKKSLKKINELVYNTITNNPISTIYKHLDKNNNSLCEQLNITEEELTNSLEDLVNQNKLIKELQFIEGQMNTSTNKGQKKIYSYK